MSTHNNKIDYINKDTLPGEGREQMKITNLGKCSKTGKQRYEIDVPIQKFSKKLNRKVKTHIRRIATGYAELQKIQSNIESLTGSSLTIINFADCVELIVKKNNGGGVPWVYERIKRELGYPIDKDWVLRYYDFIDRLQHDEKKAVNTVSNFKSCIMCALNYAVRRGLLENLPVKEFDIKREYRDRIWTPEERERIFNVMLNCNSHIYWGVWLSGYRPIRKGDLISLTNENLVLVGKHAPYLKFAAQKTGLHTIIPLKDLEAVGVGKMIDRIKHNSVLFPYGKFHIHWTTIKRKAEVHDFHFHDLKHCAITYMLDNNYTFLDLKNLHIQLSRRLIERVYYKYSPEKILDKISTLSAPWGGESACEAC